MIFRLYRDYGIKKKLMLSITKASKGVRSLGALAVVRHYPI